MTIQTAAELLAPIGLDEFRDAYLEKKVLHLERNDPSLVENLFDLDTLESALRYTQPWHRHLLRVIPNMHAEQGSTRRQLEVGQLSSMPSAAAQTSLIESMANGATLILNGAEDYAPTVSPIVNSLIEALLCPVKCNVYCTPSESQGFDVHVDAHDVLVLQTYGEKTWRLYEADTELPLESSDVANAMFPRLPGGFAKHMGRDETSFLKDVTLRPGDVLYLPRGVPHCAISLAEPSIHYTIGLYPTRQNELLGDLIDLIAYSSVELRRRVSYAACKGTEKLPSAGELMRMVADLADGLEEQIDTNLLLALQGGNRFPPTLTEGRLTSALLTSKINPDTRVSRAHRVEMTCMELSGELRLQCGVTVVSLPLKLKSVIPFLLENESYRVEGLPAELSANAKLVLTRKLVTEGMLVIDEIGDPTNAGSTRRTEEVAEFMALTDPFAAMQQPS